MINVSISGTTVSVQRSSVIRYIVLLFQFILVREEPRNVKFFNDKAEVKYNDIRFGTEVASNVKYSYIIVSFPLHISL